MANHPGDVSSRIDMTAPRDSTWDYPGLAYCGGLVGAILAIGHSVYAISSGSFEADYPFRHVLTEAVTFVGIGAIFAVALGALYKLFQHRL
jgi:hypothetical protein